MKAAKFKQILFSTEMVKALLVGRKDMTRRLVKFKKELPPDAIVERFNSTQHIVKVPTSNTEYEIIESLNNKYQVGDILWVRETWSEGSIENGLHTGIRYKADNESLNIRWKPSLFMPKRVCRIYLEVVSIRIEKLLDISTDDAISEGVLRYPSSSKWLNYISKKDAVTQFVYNLENPIDSFFSLWDAINGRNTHLENPYVWVIEFKNVTSKFIKDYVR